MNYGKFLQDFFSNVFVKNRILGNSQDERQLIASCKNEDERQLIDLCKALLLAQGEVSVVKLAIGIMTKYSHASAEDKYHFFSALTNDFDIDLANANKTIQAYGCDLSATNLLALTKAVEPKRQELLRCLNLVPGATEQLVRMREDLMTLSAKHKEFKKTDLDFQHLFVSWFNRGFLIMRPIDWSTPAEILERIIAYEAVHAINDWDDLRRRLLPSDRRCFAFFHPSMPTEPLIFVEVALCDGIPESIQGVLAEDRVALNETCADTAVFYSISSCQKGLQGISFGSFLIKQVVEELSAELPNLKTFVTLSPVPNFMKWLMLQAEKTGSDKLTNEIQVLSKSLKDINTDELIKQEEHLKPALMKLVAKYFIEEKNKHGKPFDPVARFHLGNGAILKQVNWLADLSNKGLAQSSGIMVNYLYDLPHLEANHEAFSNTNKVVTTKDIAALLDK